MPYPPPVKSITATDTNVVFSTPNAAREGMIVFNDSDKTLYLKYGDECSTSSYTVQIAAGGYWEMPLPVYRGRIDGIWASGPTGSAQVTEHGTSSEDVLDAVT